jgi:hypothetical protein
MADDNTTPVHAIVVLLERLVAAVERLTDPPGSSRHELVAMIPPRYRGRADEIIEVIRDNCGDKSTMCSEFRKRGIISKNTSICDVSFHQQLDRHFAG